MKLLGHKITGMNSVPMGGLFNSSDIDMYVYDQSDIMIARCTGRFRFHSRLLAMKYVINRVVGMKNIIMYLIIAILLAFLVMGQAKMYKIEKAIFNEEVNNSH